MKFVLYLVVALGMGAPCGLEAADEKEKKEEGKEEEKEPPPGERMEVAMKGYEEGMREYFTQMREAKTDEERGELVRPDGKVTACEVLELVKMAPDDPVSLKAVLWVARAGGRDEEVFGDVAAVVKNHYVSKEGIEDLCLMMVYVGGDKSVGLLEHIRKKSDHKPARGAATYALAQMRARDGKAGEAEKLYEKVVEEFADAEVRGKPLSEMAEGELFVIRNLAVGKEAPEIEGEKADGKPFKLSDYRGKVVVLDFFGHW